MMKATVRNFCNNGKTKGLLRNKRLENKQLSSPVKSIKYDYDVRDHVFQNLYKAQRPTALLGPFAFCINVCRCNSQHLLLSGCVKTTHKQCIYMWGLGGADLNTYTSTQPRNKCVYEHQDVSKINDKHLNMSSVLIYLLGLFQCQKPSEFNLDFSLPTIRRLQIAKRQLHILYVL